MTITPSEQERTTAPARPSTVSIGAVMTGAALGVLLLALGVPQLIAGLYATQARGVFWEVESGHSVTAKQLAAATAALDEAERWEPTAERRAELAFLLTRQAEAAPPGRGRDALYVRAMAATEAALAAGPVQPHAWAMLGVLRERAGDRQGAVEALRLSMLSGAVVPAIMVWRLEIGLRLVPYMDDDTTALLRRQVRLAWVLAPDRVAPLASDGAAGLLVRRALDDLSDEEIANYLRLHGRS